MAEAIDLSKDKKGGLLKTILTPGQKSGGHPAHGDTVYVHYVGTLKETGEKFDSSRDRGEPFKFSLAKGQVIKGWDIGVASMCKGEVADLVCSPEYAYGEAGSPPKIPANATLVFNVELLRWTGEDISPDRDGSITRSVIAEGEKHNCPAENATVTVHAVGSFNDRVFYDQELKFILGEGSECQLPEGVDKALRRMNKGEKSCVVLQGNKYNYGANPPPDFGLPPNAELVFTLFLKDFEKVKASWELTDEEKLEVAQKAKDRGTMFLNQGKYKLALYKYSGIITLMEYAKANEDEMSKKFQQMFIAALLNSSLVNLKMNETIESIKNCDKVLEKDPSNVKALYRKGQAYQQRKDYEEAIPIFKQAAKIDPENKAAVQQIAVCRAEMAAVKEREKKKFAGMFDKLAKEKESVTNGNGQKTDA